jgi:hypothetical protein
MAPIIAALISLAPTLISPAIRAVEALFGPKTGDTKMAAVVAALMPVLEKLATAGKLPGIPDPSTLETVVESVFQQDKANSLADIPSVLPKAGCFQVPAGSTVTIQLPPAIEEDIK